MLAANKPAPAKMASSRGVSWQASGSDKIVVACPNHLPPFSVQRAFYLPLAASLLTASLPSAPNSWHALRREHSTL